MKNILKITFVAALSLMMGCNDAIDIEQPGRLTASNAFTNVEDLQLGVLGLYGNLDTTPEIALASNFTDELAIGFDSGGQGFALYDFNITAASTAASNFWVRNFRTNVECNAVIEAAAGITPEAGETAAYNTAVAEARFIRAYANMEMLMYFSPDPANDSSLAQPLIDFVPALTIQPVRATTGEIWDFVNADLDFAFANLPSSSSTLASKDAIRAMRARIALTRGDYPTAESLSMSLLGSYPLADKNDYADMWLDLNNEEIIWKMERVRNGPFDGQGATGSVSAGGWAGARFAFVSATLAGSPYFEMDRSIFDALTPDSPGDDVRYDVMVSPTSIISADYTNDPDPVNNDVLVIQKYPGSDGQPLMNDLKVFRSSEMLLIAAEARAYQNNTTGAASLIKQLRDARFGSAQALPSYGSSADAIGAVLDERKVELAYEGHRYKDLKRSGVAGNRGVDRDPIACTIQSGACTLAASDFRFTLPIPIVEINANPAIGNQQNPGY